MDEEDIKGIFGNLKGFKALRPGTGKRSSFQSCCPAHEDNSPSLKIDVTHDGRILLHCFAGCDVHEICSASNIHITDLFPDKQDHKPTRRVNEPTEDHWFIAVIKAQIRKGEPVSDQDKARYINAVRREALRG